MIQLLDSPSISTDRKLLKILQEIVKKVEIQANFCIYHPEYQPWKIPVEAIDRFQKMPNEMQQKYLSLQLQSFLYSIYYNGSLKPTLLSDGATQNLPLDLENNTFLGVDLQFYNRLHESNQGEGYFDSGWSILQEESDGTLAVSKGGLRLHIEREKHLNPTGGNAKVGDLVAIHLPKNRVQNGFYMAVSNAGGENHDSSTIVRIYFNLTPDGSVAVMRGLTKSLSEKAIPFSFKVLYNPKDYSRHDSGVLYFNKQDYLKIKDILQEIYRENQLYFKQEVPLFTLKLAPGLGLAEEPDMKFSELESFGMNRCQIVAAGLLEAWYRGDNSPDSRMEAILSQFTLLKLDIQRPYLNANSEDIYIF